ncbi:PBAN-type neuropeptides-like [Aethina tumida]|uniref:PBAN-type neuropeptides-like n=1 Tax=Aethina tumida TaxID=116153 RepID=UPI002148480E|nr:PBAN-type neuropeptides-like [Aethina tumida]
MKQSTKINFALIFMSLIILEICCAESHHGNLSADKPEHEKHASELWHGPKLGRKKRNPSDDLFREELEQKEQANLFDMLQDTPWTVVAVGDGKRHVSSFTPRLGRELQDDFGSNMEFELSGRSPFSPRLGKRMTPFSPRLGR